MARIAHEIASMATNLPSSWDSSCVVRIDEEQSDAMRFMIAGPTGTPYESGLFLFDTLLPERYPQEAPMCNLMTTGGGAIRFNPNLYSCGKVCLSLLGTCLQLGASAHHLDPVLDPDRRTVLQRAGVRAGAGLRRRTSPQLSLRQYHPLRHCQIWYAGSFAPS